MRIENKKILVVAAHPDDETLGVGATINRLVKEFNCKAITLVLSKGWASREACDNKKINDNVKNLERASSIIGYSDVIVRDFPDNSFDTSPLLSIIKVIEQVSQDFDPDVVFTHSGHDLNIDHRMTYQSVLTAFRPLPDKKKVQLLSFPTLSSTEYQCFNSSLPFSPNICFEINAENLSAKVSALKEYSTEFRDYPHPRSEEAIISDAKVNGVKFGVNLAEVFQLIRLSL